MAACCIRAGKQGARLAIGACREGGLSRSARHITKLHGLIFKVVSQPADQPNVSLRDFTQTLQQRMGVNLADRKAEIHFLAEL